MTKIEMHFRKLMLAERLRQIEGELAALESECLHTDGPIIWREASQIRLSSIHVQHAVDELEAPEARNLEALLRLSIEKVREDRSKHVGGGVSPTNENARGGNLERFPKPVIVDLND